MSQYSNAGGSRYCLVSSGCSSGAGVHVTTANYPQYQGGTTCPQGYAVSGGSCVLANARQVTPDQKVDLSRSGAVLAPIADVDTTAAPIVVKTTATANDTIEVAGRDASSNPAVVRVQALSGGGSLVTTDRQLVDANGGTYVQHQIVQVGADGVVSGASAVNNAGTLSANAAGTYDYMAGAAGTSNPAATNNLTIPTDYARQGEAAAAADRIVTALDAPAVAGVDAGAPGAVAAASQSLQDRDNQISGLPNAPLPSISSNWLPSFKPGPVTSCHPLVFAQSISHGPAAGLGGVFEMDICPYLDVVREIMGWFVSMLTIWYCWRTLVRSNSGEALA